MIVVMMCSKDEYIFEMNDYSAVNNCMLTVNDYSVISNCTLMMNDYFVMSNCMLMMSSCMLTVIHKSHIVYSESSEIVYKLLLKRLQMLKHSYL